MKITLKKQNASLKLDYIRDVFFFLFFYKAKENLNGE